MEQNPFWEADRHSRSQEISRFLRSQEPTTDPYAKPDESSAHLLTLLL